MSAPRPPPSPHGRLVPPTANPALRGHIRRTSWLRVTHGAYRWAGGGGGAWADLGAWQLALPPSASFTGLTAAVVRGWWVPPVPSGLPVFVAMPNSDPRPRRPGVVICRHTQPIAYETIDGLRVTTGPETLVAAARLLSLLDLVVLGDAALHMGDCDLAQVAAAASRRRRGAPLLRQALPLLEGRAESAWESMLRMLLVSCGIPVEPQFVVRERGTFVARGDLRVSGTRRLMEYDGAVHREPEQHAADLARERRLQALGWERFGYTSDVVLHHAVSTLRDADQALGRAHRPDRIRAWHRLLSESAFTAAGRARFADRVALLSQRARETGH